MNMNERVRRNMQPDKPMTLISFRLPDHVIEDLKEVAPALGFGGYQALIRAYISNGLRKHLAEREAARAKDTAVEEFSRRLLARGISAQAIQDAAAEMRAENSSSGRLRKNEHGHLVIAATGNVLTPEMVKQAAEDELVGSQVERQSDRDSEDQR